LRPFFPVLKKYCLRVSIPAFREAYPTRLTFHSSASPPFPHRKGARSESPWDSYSQFYGAPWNSLFPPLPPSSHRPIERSPPQLPPSDHDGFSACLDRLGPQKLGASYVSFSFHYPQPHQKFFLCGASPRNSPCPFHFQTNSAPNPGHPLARTVCPLFWCAPPRVPLGSTIAVLASNTQTSRPRLALSDRTNNCWVEGAFWPPFLSFLLSSPPFPQSLKSFVRQYPCRCFVAGVVTEYALIKDCASSFRCSSPFLSSQASRQRAQDLHWVAEVDWTYSGLSLSEHAIGFVGPASTYYPHVFPLLPELRPCLQTAYSTSSDAHANVGLPPISSLLPVCRISAGSAVGKAYGPCSEHLGSLDLIPEHRCNADGVEVPRFMLLCAISSNLYLPQ